MTTKTTIHLRMPALPRNLDLPAPVAIAVVIFALLGIAAAAGRIAGTPSAAAVPTARLPEPIIIIATPQALAVPLVAPEPVQQVSYQPPPRYVTAWAAPDGVVLGPIPWNAESPMLGRYGDSWILTSWQDGQVWIRAADIGITLENLAPLEAPQIAPVYVNSPERLEAPAAPIIAPVVEQPYQVVNQPPEAPAEQPAPTIPPPQPTVAPEQAGRPLNVDTDVERIWAIEQQRQQGDLP